MPTSYDTLSVRDIALSLFDELGPCQSDPVTESVLVFNGFVRGRSFRRGGLQIVWIFEEAELKVYGVNGKLVKVVNLEVTSSKAA